MRQRAPVPFAVAIAAGALAAGIGVAGSIAPLATVAWPASTTLVVGEVVTGGASASDEFAEIYNASSGPLDLGGLELVYVTSSGSTVTRKATWSGGTVLPAGAHLLVANSSGIYAGIADAVYSGGFAATGGALVLRPIGGTPIDAVGWGDATNAFVEGTTAPAPPAGQSIERRPGGLAGNGTDTNANALDFFVDSAPAAQSLAAPPVPAPVATPSPSPSLSSSPTPSVTASPAPSDSSTPTVTATSAATATAEATASATADATATAEATPTDSPTPSSTPSVTESPAPTSAPLPTPTATVTATASPSPSPSQSPVPVLTVADARSRADGAIVDVEGMLTTSTGLIESGTGAFLQDDTAGVAIYLASADWTPVAAGTLVRVHGSLDDRYAQRTIRLASAADLVAVGAGVEPVPMDVATGMATEVYEGSLLTVAGRVVSSADVLSDGFAVTLDDGSGPLRIVAPAASGVNPASLPAQGWFQLTGPLGQRDSSGTGTAGYRLYLRSAADVAPLPVPSPSPAPTPAPTAIPSASASPTSIPSPSATSTPFPSPGVTPSPTPSALPSPTSTPPAALPIGSARGLPLGSTVIIQGTATVEPGRIIDARTAFVQDASGGIAVHLPTAGWPAFGRGDVLRVTGILAAPYGNLEVRPATPDAITVTGRGVVPTPRSVMASDIGESTEGLLVRVLGIITAVDAASTTGSFGVDVQDASGTLRVYVYGTTSIARSTFVKGATVDVTGIEGQRAPSSGSPDGHRVWPRDPADVRTVVTSPSPGPTGSPAPGATGTPQASWTIPIATAIRDGGSVTVAGTVTTPAGFIDTDGRRVVIEDASGALIARLPSDASAPAVGTRIVASGTMGTYYGSPQLELASAPAVAGLAPLSPLVITSPPGTGLAWRLVRATGTVTEVHRLGTTWRAELSVGVQTVPVYGTARSGVPSTALVEGRSATITGVVRPPYPTATDRRSAIAPRFVADITLGRDVPGGSGSGATGTTLSDPARGGIGAGASALDVELAELGEHQGQRVRVGGFVTSMAGARFTLDDGTATAAVILPADALGLIADVRVGDPINATGLVVADGDAFAVAPASAAEIARVGRLGESEPLVSPTPTIAPEPAPSMGPRELGAHGPWPIGPLPTLIALGGTLGIMAVRRRGAAMIARRAVQALPVDGPIGALLRAMSGLPNHLSGLANHLNGRLRRLQRG